jgi:hypothetical protein
MIHENAVAFIKTKAIIQLTKSMILISDEFEIFDCFTPIHGNAVAVLKIKTISKLTRSIILISGEFEILHSLNSITSPSLARKERTSVNEQSFCLSITR